MDEKTLEEATKVFTEVVATGTVYQDAIQPVAKQIGRSLETLGGVINVALSPVALMVHGYELIQEKLKQKLEDKLRDVPKEKIVSPPLPVVGPLLENYRFVHDQAELAELYENLLAGAMKEDTVRQAHPAFVHVISQLCPDEAKLLNAISRHPLVIPKLDVQASFKADAPGGPWPTEGTLDLWKNFTNLDREAKIDPTLTRAFIINLERLGILEIRSGVAKLKDGLYDDLVSRPELVSKQEQVKEFVNLRIIKGSIDTTDFGQMFINAVVSKPSQ
jgi:Abortive infection alpha